MEIPYSLFSGYQRICLQLFAESIQLCNRFGSHKWGVAVAADDHVRLLMGSLIVASIEQYSYWLAVDIPDIKERNTLDQFLNWRWTPQFYYRRPPSMSGYYWPMKNHAEIWPAILRLHQRYLTTVAETYDHLRIDSQPHHSDDLLLSIENFLKISLPRPNYQPKKS